MKSKEKILVDTLTHKNYHIAFAESCTGGLAAARLINVPSASRVLDASVITYADEAKIKYLGVNKATISEFGVVSEQVAAQMASGVAVNNGAQIGVGITGIAGPTGGSEKKPIGTVCFAFYINGKIKTYTAHFGSIGRNKVRKASVDFVYDKLNELLDL